MLQDNLEAIKLLPGGQSIIVNFEGHDQTSGLGTLTFIEPSLNRYGALGHLVPICSRIKKQKCLVRASVVQSIQTGTFKEPGTKNGMISSNSSLSGNVLKASRQGIFGIIKEYTANPYFTEPIHIARCDEIELGPAKMYTVIDGEKIEEFEVLIKEIKSWRRRRYDLVIEVVDPLLIEKTHGIIQGMSGSPIIQKGRFIGAVAYFSRKNNLEGYVVYIGKMLMNFGCTERIFSKQCILKFLRRSRFVKSYCN
jgi:stage IV sporulation protein B